MSNKENLSTRNLQNILKTDVNYLNFKGHLVHSTKLQIKCRSTKWTVNIGIMFVTDLQLILKKLHLTVKTRTKFIIKLFRKNRPMVLKLYSRETLLSRELDRGVTPLIPSNGGISPIRKKLKSMDIFSILHFFTHVTFNPFFDRPGF